MPENEGCSKDEPEIAGRGPEIAGEGLAIDRQGPEKTWTRPEIRNTTKLRTLLYSQVLSTNLVPNLRVKVRIDRGVARSPFPTTSPNENYRNTNISDNP